MLQELDAAIQLLQDKRQQVATHESSNKLQLLMLFLQHAKYVGGHEGVCEQVVVTMFHSTTDAST